MQITSYGELKEKFFRKFAVVSWNFYFRICQLLPGKSAILSSHGAMNFRWACSLNRSVITGEHIPLGPALLRLESDDILVLVNRGLSKSNNACLQPLQIGKILHVMFLLNSSFAAVVIPHLIMDFSTCLTVHSTNRSWLPVIRLSHLLILSVSEFCEHLLLHWDQYQQCAGVPFSSVDKKKAEKSCSLNLKFMVQQILASKREHHMLALVL